MNLDAVRARLKALRAKTTDKGCTEAEAIAAAEKAAELLASYGLTEADLAAPDFADVEALVSARRSPLDSIWPSVATFCTCRCYLTGTGSQRRIVYFGRAGDVLVAEYIHDVIRRACERGAKEFRASEVYKSRRTAGTRANALRAWQEGFMASLVLKLRDGLWKRLRDQYGAQSVSDASGIQLVHLNPVDIAMSKRGIETRPLPALKKSQGRFRDDARTSGFVAGKGVQINAGVAGAGPGPALLPPPRG